MNRRMFLSMILPMLAITAAPAIAQTLPSDPERPQIRWSDFIHLRGKITKSKDRPAVYVNEAKTFAAARIVYWTVAGKDAQGKAKFQAHFISIVAFGDQVKALAKLKDGQKVLVQGQLDMIPKAKRHPKGDTHRVIIRYLEVLPETKKTGESNE